MRIVKMKLSDLKPAEYNPRVELEPGMPEFEKLKQSIEEYDFVEPPIVNKRTGNLVGGHQRVAVAQYLDRYEEIEVSIVDLPLDKEKALNVALNKISGRWDEEKLSSLLREFSSEDLSLSGFDKSEADELIKSFEVIPHAALDDFSNSEIELDDFSNDKFDCECPKCGFRFMRGKEND